MTENAEKNIYEKLREYRTKYGLNLPDEVLAGLTIDQANALIDNIEAQVNQLTDQQTTVIDSPPNPMLESAKAILREAMKSPDAIALIERIEATENRIINIEKMLIKMQKK